MIKIKVYEDVKITYEYELELTDEYIKNFNDYLQTKLKPVNAERIPYIDAEVLAGIYEEGYYEEAKILLNKKLKEKGHEPYIDIQVTSKEFFTDCEGCICDLYDIISDILNEDVWNSYSEEVDSDTLGYKKEVERGEED